MLLFTLLAIALAQGLVTVIWYTQIKQRETQGLTSAMVSFAAKIAVTADNFQSLPIEYRHLVVEQLRQMSSERFFVSMNEEYITIESLKAGQMKQLVLTTMRKELQQRLVHSDKLSIDFSSVDSLHVLNNQLLLKDLPKSWAHYALSIERSDSAILVVQLLMNDGQWLYIAGLLPEPYNTLDGEIIPFEQALFISLVSILMLLFVFMLVRWQLYPLRMLARAADSLSRDINKPQLVEQGATELVETTRAFNRMQTRLKRFLDDKEQLFRAISHDLKTPITRLRLRVELLDDESKIEKFSKDLDELELLVKGALQTVKETSIHENVETIDIQELLSQLAEHHNNFSPCISIKGSVLTRYRGKPLAIKRCLSNIINNGIKYGNKLNIVIKDNEDLCLKFQDQGPGIPEDSLQSIFTPYVRLHDDNDGHGLGLGIARDIVLAHGGTMTLHNLTPVGLEVCITLPRAPEEFS